jgi:hypothetical protein
MNRGSNRNNALNSINIYHTIPAQVTNILSTYLWLQLQHDIASASMKFAPQLTKLGVISHSRRSCMSPIFKHTNSEILKLKLRFSQPPHIEKLPPQGIICKIPSNISKNSQIYHKLGGALTIGKIANFLLNFPILKFMFQSQLTTYIWCKKQ